MPRRLQKGNPHQLSVRQHVFPAASISRFADADGSVEVYIRRPDATKRLSPSNPVFCAKGVWSQSAEIGFMKSIEDEFQQLAQRIVEEQHEPEEYDHVVATRFFTLWNLRSEYKENPAQAQRWSGILKTEYDTTQDQLEQLEKAGITPIRTDGSIAGHDMASLQIRRAIIHLHKMDQSVTWGVMRTARGEFLVPDAYGTARTGPELIPITPQIFLAARQESCELTMAQLRQFNRLAIERYTHFYFARSIEACPR